MAISNIVGHMQVCNQTFLVTNLVVKEKPRWLATKYHANITCKARKGHMLLVFFFYVW